ncbi:hypothetical protein KKH3_00710 [Pectobacterium actinidiae]|nr:hypothetical protein KKH3_00710 [Pectobacterium actinidiae]
MQKNPVLVTGFFMPKNKFPRNIRCTFRMLAMKLRLYPHKTNKI